ncbi:DNA polymerase III subunit delta [Sulfuriferula nivalis]|uniref:DNA polymerase III subunit delta n=1 Tax=Sulfuriferula nivalis TaxID=2675298 RepID=A0A809RJ69_9PROT|nr:DNA polymerase III subunit delta [Sulfuriferula nivalis]BBP01545.1 DNA polymerase III subunit delta [Sulfuriferula nivalis]
MRIKPEQLAAHLAKELRPLYCIYGDEPLLILEAADQIRHAARQQGYSERETHQVEGRYNWQNLLSSGENLSLFGDRRFIDIRIPSGKPGVEGSKALISYSDALPNDSVSLITLPKLDRQTTNSKWFNALDQAGVVITVYPITLDQLPRWIGERLARQQQQADHDTLQFLTQKVEGNLLAAQQEINKLGLLFPPGRLDFASVRDAVLDVARYDVFKLADAMLNRDVARIIRMLEGLQQEGEAPTLILWTITRELRILTRLKQAQENGIQPARIMREVGVWESRQGLVERALSNVKSDTLTRAMHQAASIDRMIKGWEQGDPWAALRQLALTVAMPKTEMLS